MINHPCSFSAGPQRMWARPAHAVPHRRIRRSGCWVDRKPSSSARRLASSCAYCCAQALDSFWTPGSRVVGFATICDFLVVDNRLCLCDVQPRWDSLDAVPSGSKELGLFPSGIPSLVKCLTLGCRSSRSLSKTECCDVSWVERGDG